MDYSIDYEHSKSWFQEKLSFLIQDSIKLQTISDYPIGTYLSGGIDSASIVSIMKRYYTEDLHTFSVGFHEKSYNEIPDAEKVSKWFETIHHSYLSDLGGELDPTNIAIDSFDEPFSDTSLIPTFEVSKNVESVILKTKDFFNPILLTVISKVDPTGPLINSTASFNVFP